MGLPTLDIVIVNWNTGKALAHCLESIRGACHEGFQLLRVCVVDNASTDNSLDDIEDFTLPCVVHRNPSNRGFAAACNDGARGSSADYLLFLNPDTRLTPTSLFAPISFMEEPENQRVGICGLPLLDDSGQPGTCCAAFPSVLLLCAESCGLNRLFPRRFRSYPDGPRGVERHISVDQVIGAFFFVRATAFQTLGGFDDRFFMYYEEVDFSLRALTRGYTSCVLFDTFAYHSGGVSSNHVKDLRLFYSLRSKLQYAHKHFSAGGQLLVGMFTLLLEPGVRGLHGVCTTSDGSITTTIRGYSLLLRALLVRLCHKVPGLPGV
jgi:N-acetylglucosaminyl-diphospho-decaprenol L-rhamnosyltransferase